MSPAEMRAWIREALDPIESFDPHAPPAHSDFDLNPDALPDAPTSFTPASVLVPLVEHDAGVTVLLTRRADTLRSHTGQIAFPGGRCDPGETPWAAALREAEEEIGLPRDAVELWGTADPYRTVTNFLVTPVVGLVPPDLPLSPHEHEVADLFEAPLSFVLDPANQKRMSAEFRGATRHYCQIDWNGRRIWGATAAMIVNLTTRLHALEGSLA